MHSRHTRNILVPRLQWLEDYFDALWGSLVGLIRSLLSGGR